MPIEFYDNKEPISTDDGDCLVEIERVYCLDWYEFEEAHWKELERIYTSLPGRVRYHAIPYWFGDDEQDAAYLNASVEPPGLQVCGVLRAADWRAWDEQFRSQADVLPSRDFDDER
jgi:hypothetical protein